MLKKLFSKKTLQANLFTAKPDCKCDDSVIVNGDAVAVAKDVIVLGPGCAKCKETFKVVERVISESHLAVRLAKVEDIAEIMSYNIITTPAVVVDGTVKIKGHVPTTEEVRKALGI